MMSHRDSGSLVSIEIERTTEYKIPNITTNQRDNITFHQKDVDVHIGEFIRGKVLME